MRFVDRFRHRSACASIAYREGLCAIQFCHGLITTMFHSEHELLANLIVLSPKLARRKFREHIFEAWDWQCAYCSKQLNSDTATIDHVIPKHKGGQNVRNNMICSCSSCNRSKASQLLQSWFNPDHPHYTEERLARITKWMEQKPCSIKLNSTEPAIPYLANDYYIGWIAT